MNMILATGENLMTWLQAKMIYDIIGVGFADNLTDMMKDMANFDSVWSVIDSFSESIKMVASMLLVIHFLCYILEAVTKEQVSTDIFFKGFIKFIIGFFVVQNCSYLFGLLMDLGDLLGAEMTLSTSASSLSVEDIEKGLIHHGHMVAFNFTGTIYDGNLFTNIGNVLLSIVNLIVCMPTTFLFWIVAFAATLIAVILMTTRTLELAVRALFAPIAIVDLFEHGTNGSGFKYIKKFLAVAIQGAVIMAIMMMVGALAGLDVGNLASEGPTSSAMEAFLTKTVISTQNAAHLGDVLKCYAKCVIFTLAGVGLSMKSQQVCNDIIGV